MKQFSPVFALLLLALVTACASMGIPTPETFNERAAAATVTVTGVRSATLDLLKTGRINAADAQNAQDQADIARKGIDVARSIYKTDPAGADARLTATITALQALQTYLRTRGAQL
jgi:ABC-type Fe3+-hydroxamate transport system substrate-binding protein